MKRVFILSGCRVQRMAMAATLACLLNGCKHDVPSEDSGSPIAAYAVSGVVIKSDGGAATGASVMLIRTSDGSTAGQSPTNAAGEYVITTAAAGTYKIAASLSGYTTYTSEAISISADASHDIVLQQITTETYTISGRITTADDAAAAGAVVKVFSSTDNTMVGQAVNADAQGDYSVSAIPAGTYTIAAIKDGYDAGIIMDVIINNTNLEDRNVILARTTIPDNVIVIHFSEDDADVIVPSTQSSITYTKNGAHVSIAIPAAYEGDSRYFVYGTTTNGSLKIQNNPTTANNIYITLNSAIVTSANANAPIVVTKNAGSTTFTLNGTSIISDHPTNSENAAIISNKGSIVFDGYGALRCTGSAKHAIGSKEKSILVNGGDISIINSATDGMHAEDGFTMQGGTLTISGSSDGIDAGSGAVDIRGGTIHITSTADDVKAIKGDAAVQVSGGSITMSVSGKQSKGIATKGNVSITNGSISITTSGAAVVEDGAPSYCTAIKSDNDVTITNGTINIVSAATADGGKGISADGTIAISGGALNITTAGNGAVYTTASGTLDSYTSACLKSNSDVVLAAGTITCVSTGKGGKGINADGAITIGTIGGSNDALHLNVSTSGERILVSGSAASGQHGMRPGGDNLDYANPKAVKCGGDMLIHSGTIYINCTQHSDGGEGLESKGTLTINGGAIDIHTYDDCINAVNIVVNGGSVYAAAAGNDAIDANGAVTINGGLVIANGVRGDGEAFDADRTVTLNGGTILGTCGSTMSRFAGSQKYYKTTAAAGSSICLRDAQGNALLLFTLPIISGASTGTNVTIILSTPQMTSGSYTLLTGGTITGGVTINGYNTGGTYSGGSARSITL